MHAGGREAPQNTLEAAGVRLARLLQVNLHDVVPGDDGDDGGERVNEVDSLLVRLTQHVVNGQKHAAQAQPRAARQTVLVQPAGLHKWGVTVVATVTVAPDRSRPTRGYTSGV